MRASTIRYDDGGPGSFEPERPDSSKEPGSISTEPLASASWVPMEADRVVVAEILRERGNRGEVTARSQTDVPGRLESLKSAWLHLPDGTDRPVKLERAWSHKGDWVLKFAEVDSISDAEKLRGADLWVPLEQRARLPEGEYYESDLVGCMLRKIRGGELVGKVTGMQRFGGPPLLEVDRNGREVLVPFVPAICQKVDVAAQEIGVELPEGLLEL